ncbi:DUF5686 and carboxypeptidase-like regulatory domain-containing protein [Rufibacter sp. LB8]|uniref:DUF5686 and carboxypeptidase-like regulatory domain-containing protein n=1 Tax=Rufibacter sp. LB8 TaxID=2777781 RepID=UPI00178C4BF4|nr:DUF5686 and carboxypeptidase-like regulatory domain-containing protein [Rufibacter sp. LB8]
MQSRVLVAFLFVLMPMLAQAQGLFLKGQVIHSQTKAPLAFASIAVKGSQVGTTSDINGNFSLRLAGTSCALEVSSVGFEKAEVACGSFTPGEVRVILLQEKATGLQEVVVRPGQNPAHRIIRQAVQHKARHDPEQLPAFQYNSYNKTVATLKGFNPDALDLDSSSSSEGSLFKKSHLFVSESYTLRSFLAPNHTKEIVLANKMTGYKDPILAMVGTDFQPFSFYQDQVTFFDQHFLNPLSAGSLKKYDFYLEETLVRGQDTTFLISYAPLPGKNIAGLQGVLAISSDGFAIENVTAEPAAQDLLVKFRIQQKYRRVQGRWFPDQLHLVAGFTQYKLGGGNLVLTTKSYLSNVQLSPALQKKDFNHVKTQMAPLANRQPEAVWQQYRADSLNVLEQNTYRLYDSLGTGTLNLLNTYMHVIEGLVLNRYKLGKVDLIPSRLFSFNTYEQYRLGLGLQTNEDFSKILQLGGYVAYGTGDHALKYGGNLGLNLHRQAEAVLELRYQQDVSEPGSVAFFQEHQLPLSQESLGDFIISRMDRVEQLQATLKFRVFKYLQVRTSLTQEARNPGYAYRFANPAGDDGQPNPDFQTVEAGIGLRLAVQERYTQIGRGAVVLKPSFPVFTFYYGRGLDGFADRGEFAYHRLALKVDHAFYLRNMGSTEVQLAAGMITGTLPYPYLNNGHGSRTGSFLGDLFIPNRFQTMALYEFAANRYAYFFLTHNFGKLLYKGQNKYFQPELVFTQNVGFGQLKNMGQHEGISFKTMEKGFFESGLSVDNLVRFPYLNVYYLGLGAGVFYRYGEYAVARQLDNFALKATFSFSF